MKALMVFYDNIEIMEFFNTEKEQVIYNPGEAFIDFIELDSAKDLKDYATIKNPYFKLFEGKEDFAKNKESIIEAISEYKIAAFFTLSSEIAEFNDVDTMTRFYLYRQYCYPEISDIKIKTSFVWSRLESDPKADESKIDFSNGTFCHETFKGLADSVKGCSYKVTETYEINNIKEALHVSFMNMVINNVIIKKCKCCGKYFIPKGRIDTEYCDRIAPNSIKACNEIGAIKAYHIRSKNNPIMSAFQKEYKKQNARVRLKKISQQQFFDWSEKARAVRNKAIDENISVDNFLNLLETVNKNLNQEESE